MSQEFAYFEDGIDRVAAQMRGMPRDEVVLSRLFFFVFKKLDDLHNRHLSAFGLNTSSFLALVMLLAREDNCLNPIDLSNALVASRTNVTRLTDELVAAGWVSRTPNTEDRRRIDLALTHAGRAFILSVLPHIWTLLEQQWAGFSAAECSEFDRLLRKLLHGVTQFEESA